jgi:hypothetical protein
VQSEFASVVPPEALIWQTVGLLSKIPPSSKEFSAGILSVMVERVRRVLKTHPEFEALTDSQQEILWSRFYETLFRSKYFGILHFLL